MIRVISFLVALFLLSCTDRQVKSPAGSSEEITSEVNDSIRYELFAVGKGFGFNIIKKGKTYIHQPFIPCEAGWQIFADENQAASVAKFITNRLVRDDFNFLLQKFEVDSLLKVTATTIETASKAIIEGLPGVPQKDLLQEMPASKPGALSFVPEPPLKNKWTAKENAPFGHRYGTFGFAIGRNVYIGSGEFRDEIIRDLWAYNADSETWTCCAEIPGKCFSGVAFSLFKKGYVGLGTEIGTSSGKFEKHMYQYSPESNSWLVLKDFPGTGRIDAACFVIGGKAYVGSGYDGNNTKDFYEYDPVTDKWRQIADFAGGYIHASVGVGTGRNGFVVAGARAPHDYKFVFEYVPSENKWKERKELPAAARFFLSGNYIDSNHFIICDGGTYIGQYNRLRDGFVYDIEKGTWARAGDYPASTEGSTRAVGGTIDGKIYMGTGDNGKFLNDWNVFEYYYSVRTNFGDYSEISCYPLKYDGSWELFQECSNDDCFAGAQIKCSESLGDFCYSSRFVHDLRNIEITGTPKNYVIFPRNFVITTLRQPAQAISLRLFFTKAEIQKAVTDCNEKTGTHHGIDDVEILQFNEARPDIELLNNSRRKENCLFVKPRWYRYGSNGETFIAEFAVASLHSEFYLAIADK